MTPKQKKSKEEALAGLPVDLTKVSKNQLQEALNLAWETGRLAYKLRPHQRRAYDQFYGRRDSKKFVMVCGRRYGKSVLLLTLCAERCLRESGVQCAYVAPVETGIAGYIQPIIDTVFDDCPSYLRPEFKKGSIEFKNGSRIMFNGCNMRSYRTMRGQKLALAVVDEMAEVDDLEGAVDDVLFPAVWDSHGEMVLSGTPPVVPSPEHPVIRYVETAKLTGSYFHGTVYDAGYTEEEIAVAMREVGINGKESDRFRREFMAEFVRDTSSVVVPEFNHDLHVKDNPRPEYYNLLFKCFAADLGVVDNTVGLFAYYDFPRATIVIQDEMILKGDKVRTDIVAREIRAREKVLGWTSDRTTRWADNNNLMLINDLNGPGHGISISATGKGQKAGNEMTMVNTARIMFGQNRIEINPNCKFLITTLECAFWDKDKKQFGRTKELGHMDALDALIYLVRNINMSINPFPTNYGLHPDLHAMNPLGVEAPTSTAEGEMFKKIFDKGRFMNKPTVKRIWSAI